MTSKTAKKPQEKTAVPVEIGTTVQKSNHGSNPGNRLIPQPHGGALRFGGTNKGGPGRPRDIHRDKLVKLCTSTGIKWLRELLAAPRELVVTCECGKSQTVENPPAQDKVRLQAIDIAHKYGIGTYKEVEETRTVTLVAPDALG